MLTAILDYGAGNLHSVRKAVETAGKRLRDNQVAVTHDSDIVAKADRIIIPGDGAFPTCFEQFEASGLRTALDEAVLSKGRPCLGICLGMHFLATRSFEQTETEGLGWVPGEIVRIPSDTVKLPHIGWNELEIDAPHPVISEVATGSHAYFIHSYRFKVQSQEDLVAHVEHGTNVTAVVARDNIVGIQFHPEKSQATGLLILENFLTWSGDAP